MTSIGRTTWIFILSISLFIPANAATPPIAGTKCPKEGRSQVFLGKKFTCIKKGKRLIWDKGTLLKIDKPIPTTTPGATSSPTATPTPSTIKKVVGTPTNFQTSWQGTTFVMSFNFPINLVDSTFDNTKVTSFEITLYLKDGSNKKFVVKPNALEAQNYGLTLEGNMQSFGVPQSSFLRVTLSTVTTDGEVSPPITANQS